ncbi:MAG: DUF2959 family protein [Vicinamibacterales bacterium]
MPRRLSTARALAVIALAGIALAGCDSLYYKTMKKFGWEKRDILVKKVLEARGAQADAQKEFQTTLERFREIVTFDGGSLEDKYNKLNDALQRSEDRAKKVDERITAVRDVSGDLFKEWQGELGKYSDRGMRQESERQLRDTKARTETLIRSMAQAQKRVEPVLTPLRDRVLFLKHNLNARAMGALSKELDGVAAEVDALVEDLRKSVAEADAFLAEMDQAKRAETAQR